MLAGESAADPTARVQKGPGCAERVADGQTVPGKVNSVWGRQSSVAVTLAMMDEGSSFVSMLCSPPVLQQRRGDIKGCLTPRWQGGMTASALEKG